MELRNIYGNVIFALDTAKTILELVLAAKNSGADLRSANLRSADLYGADLYGANLSGANLYGADLRSAKIDGKVIDQMVTVQSSAYPYPAYAVLFQDGSRYIRMGCLWKSLEEWDSIGIRKSNLSEFPDDGSGKSENRAALFEFLHAALLRMKSTKQ